MTILQWSLVHPRLGLESGNLHGFVLHLQALFSPKDQGMLQKVLIVPFGEIRPEVSPPALLPVEGARENHFRQIERIAQFDRLHQLVIEDLPFIGNRNLLIPVF